MPVEAVAVLGGLRDEVWLVDLGQRRLLFTVGESFLLLQLLFLLWESLGGGVFGGFAEELALSGMSEMGSHEDGNEEDTGEVL